MSRFDRVSLDPEAAEALAVIDATLAGDAVEPRHAELAELALLLRAERPEVPLALSAELDQRVQERFAPRGVPRPRGRRAWLLAPAAGLAASIVVAIVIVLSQPGSSPQQTNTNASSGAASSRPALRVPAPAARSAPAALGLNIPAPAAVRTSSADAASLAAATVSPPPNGRRIIQGGQLALSTNPSRMDTVAQEVFQVAGRENAIVLSSNVTAGQGPGGYAQFQLSIPSPSLSQAMAALSTLPYARVASRTDTTQDVNDQYLGDQHALSDARALRTALLRALAAAVSQVQIDSLTARIHDAEASISSDEASLRTLNHRIGFSQVAVTINAASVSAPVRHGGGFTLRRAAHDAGRVLTVAAGVALIGLAALVPVGLVAALLWWAGTQVRRHRRERALDLA